MTSKETATPVTSPQPGNELCYECDGSRLCIFCGGRGHFNDGQRCSTCFGEGWCIVCGGAGELGAGSRRAALGETPKVTLRRIGNFQELGYDDDPTAPKLSEVRGKRATPNKARVVQYLKSGKTFIFSPGYDQDIFDDRKRTDTCSILTDGTFMWQKQIAYYVEHYDIELPEDFEAHMRANDWKIPESIDIKQLEAPRPPTN